MNYRKLNVIDKWDNTVIQFRIWEDGDVGINDETQSFELFVRAEDAVKLRKLLPKPKDKQSKLDELLEWIDGFSSEDLEVRYGLGFIDALATVHNKILELKGK